MNFGTISPIRKAIRTLMPDGPRKMEMTTIVIKTTSRLMGKVNLGWPAEAPKAIWYSDFREVPGETAQKQFNHVALWCVNTLSGMVIAP